MGYRRRGVLLHRMPICLDDMFANLSSDRGSRLATAMAAEFAGAIHRHQLHPSNLPKKEGS